MTKKKPSTTPFGVMLGFDLVPFLSQEEIADRVIRTKLTVDRFVGGEQIAHLNVQLFAALVAYKINFLIARSANGHFIAPAQQFQIFRFYYNCRMAGDRFFAADRSEPQ